MKLQLLRSAFLSFLVFAICPVSQAQTNSPDAQLSGQITDPSGYGLAGVRVTVRSESAHPGPGWSATSSAEGTYLLDIPSGRYHVHLTRASFLARDFTLDLAASEKHKLDLHLEIQQVSENIVVTANAQPIEVSQTPAPVDLVARQEIEQRQTVLLPDLLATQPGIAIARTGRIGGLTTVFLDGGNSSFAKLLIDGSP